MKLTERQRETLAYVERSGPVRSGSDGSILWALEKKGLVLNHQFPDGQNMSYTWTITKEGKAALDEAH